jgi:Cu(I)/Ag(I) efflux system membrane fusion protein/cobalt-zinc-cadmium efflux system membrane fusion protein
MRGGRLVSLLGVAILAVALGWVGRGWLAPAEDTAGGGGSSASKAGPCPGGGQPKYWKAPMDPTYVREAPGKSPMGMDLVPVCEDEGGSGAGTVRVSPDMVQSIGVRTARVERRDLSRRVRAVGRVDYDERLVDHVHTKIQGWVERLYVEYEGEMVKRGQPLLELYSPELVSTQEELLLAARYRDTTSESPFPDVSEGGSALFDATRRRLELWDIPERDVDRLLSTGEVRKSLTLYAPSSGVVTHLMVRKGMEVSPSENLYTIADLSRVWLYADVYEYELPWIEVGQKGSVELSYMPGRTFEGEVTYVYPYLDPKTRTARVRLELSNDDRTLKPDMFANVTIETEIHRGVLAIPDEAVIRSGQRNLVIVALAEGRFEPRDLEIGIDSGDGWLEARAGLHEGEKIVTSGQFLIDSESRLREAVQKLLSAGDADAGHEGHSMPEAAAPAPAADPHAGHEMPEADEHARHEMPEAAAPAPAADPHAGHEMPGSGAEE